MLTLNKTGVELMKRWTITTLAAASITVWAALWTASRAEAATATTPARNSPLVEWPKRSETWVPVHPITRGPAYHWFGYYDKLQFDPSGHYVLGMEVTFEDRSPRPDDVIKIGMIDLHDNDRWIELGET